MTQHFNHARIVPYPISKRTLMHSEPSTPSTPTATRLLQFPLVVMQKMSTMVEIPGT